MVDKAELSEQQEWNMAALLNNELALLRNRANTFYISGKFNEAFQCLVAIKSTSIHVMNEDERKRLEDLEHQFFKYINVIGSRLQQKNSKLYNKVAGVVFNTYKQYNDLLQDLLNRYGFLGDTKKDSSRIAGMD